MGVDGGLDRRLSSFRRTNQCLMLVYSGVLARFVPLVFENRYFVLLYYSTSVGDLQGDGCKKTAPIPRIVVPERFDSIGDLLGFAGLRCGISQNGRKSPVGARNCQIMVSAVHRGWDFCRYCMCGRVWVIPAGAA